MYLFINARIVFLSVCPSVTLCSFFECLARQFWTKVDSLQTPFNDAQTVTDLLFLISQLFLSVFLFLLLVSLNGAHLSTEYLITCCPVDKYLSVCNILGL